MRQIEIVFTKSKKPFPIGSWLIRLWTRKPYSHVAVKFETKIFGIPTYYQASDGLVNYMSELQFLKKHEIVTNYKLYVNEELYWNIRKDCHREAGADYGFMQNIGIFLTDILAWFGIKVSNPWKKGKNCSELLYVHIFKDMTEKEYNPDKIKPGQVEDIIEELISEQIDQKHK